LGKLAKRETLEPFWTATEPSQHRLAYGLGFEVGAVPGARVVGHAGGFAGMSGSLDVFLDTGFVIAVLGNGDGVAGPARDKALELIGRLRGGGAP
jgi:hypothetical protein